MSFMATKERAREKYSTKDKAFWRMMGSLVCASMITYANLYFVQPVMPMFVRDFAISSAEASLSLSLSVLALMAGLLVFGLYSDRIGRRRIMDIGLVCSIIPIGLMPLLPSFASLLVLRMIQGFFLAAIPAAAIAYVSEEVERKSVGLGIMLYIASNGLGGMLGRVFIGYLADEAGWHAALYSLLAAETVLFICYIWWISPSRFFKPSQRTLKEDIRGMVRHMRDVRLLPLFLSGIMLQIAFTGVWTYMPFYLHGEPFGWSLKTISFIYLAYIAGIVGSALAGKLSQFFAKTRILTVGSLFFIGGAVMTLSPSGVWIVIGLVITCLGFFVVHSLMTAIVNERATHHKGGASSFYLFSYYLGVAIGGTLTAFIWEAIGWIGVALLSLMLIPSILWIRLSGKKAEN
ncbi:MFS transporter [Bacillus xiapuensis]|uniref:MFS transporter n=1 Tax=Bacillus xiapuensis TaxID=2014075 RepID=UPI000C23432B|nr:MFS transporter [Bacillus xiapuensis]